MSEQNESYEELVKKLKGFSVVVHRISDQKLKTLKVVDDPSRIKDHLIIDDTDPHVDDIHEEEVEVVLAELEAQPIHITIDDNEDNRLFKCFFCQIMVKGSEAFNHLQLHIDYYPIQCDICDEALTDVMAFVKHCHKSHPELETVKYIKKFSTNCNTWIEQVLKAGSNQYFMKYPQKYCPACEWVHLSAVNDVNDPNPQSMPKPMQVLKHIHEHILYKPYQCTQCKVNRKDFRIHVLDASTRNHFLSEHKDLVIDGGYHQFFKKRFIIPSIDKYISNYLGIFDLKVPKNRNKKRTKTDSSVVKTLGQTILTNGQQKSSGLPIPTAVQKIIDPSKLKVLINDGPLTLDSLMANTTKLQAVVINGQLCLAPMASNPNLIQNPLHVYPSSNHINANPFPVEAGDLNIICVDPKEMELEDRQFKYLCVFCTESPIEFTNKTEALVHYAIHFNYNPIVCMICDHRFVDLSLLITHYTKEHNVFKNHLFHYLKEDEKIEKWILTFLDFQRNVEFKGNVSGIYGDLCFVCDQMCKSMNIQTPDEHKVNFKNVKETEIREHIHKHLHYFPYRCSICFHGGRDVRFHAQNVSAFQHMQKIHSISASELLSREWTKLIVKTDEISDLEKFIDDKVAPKREKIERNPLTYNIKRKLEEIETESKKIRTLNSSPSMSSVPSAQVHPIVRSVNVTASSRILQTPTAPILSHMLLGQNSVQNVPSKDSLRNYRMSNNHINNVIHQATTNGLNRQPMRALLPKSHSIQAVQPSKEAYIEPFLLCFHCHDKVLNAADLEVHHNNKHPKLTIASYTPNKADIAAFNRRSLNHY